MYSIKKQSRLSQTKNKDYISRLERQTGFLFLEEFLASILIIKKKSVIIVVENLG